MPYQWLSGCFTVHQIRFRPGLRPEPHGGANIVPPDPLSALRGPASKGEEKGKGREREGPAPLSQIPGSAPD